ncbi:MAG: hypothetical protein ABJD97_13275 [Betaproteobacteria bacterium]
MSKRKVALPLLAGAALIGLLWFSFRDHSDAVVRDGSAPVLQPATPQR